MSLTPDLVEWLVADKKVCQRWKNLARRLNLGSYIVSIERLCEEESGQLRLMLRLCQAVSPTSYTVRGIKSGWQMRAVDQPDDSGHSPPHHNTEGNPLCHLT
eukprot:GFUD01075052.1.p2 GENE.GFUD01075052.1~~GFUD01075052.1.p2  ORF type:complete len:102 (+),score=33.44 GFUD01075052.1:169-474(+)